VLKELTPDFDKIISAVRRYYDIRLSTLKAVRHGIENEAGCAAIDLIKSMRAEPLHSTLWQIIF
jgi:hypothetical protein